MNEDKIKHLEFIQKIVTRMNTNSFQIKRMCVTIVAALIAIFVSNKNLEFILIAMFPVIIFWMLDSYYLLQERKFRGLYGDVAGYSKNPKKIKPYEMRPDLYVGKKYSYWNVLWSKTVALVYIPILTVLISLYFLQS